jgi:sigma-B regulation protein RsbU (phosphoserine phosphatase)
MPIDPSVLQSLPLFAALPEDELRRLSEQMRPCHFEAGDLVLREGDQCDEFYIVVAGAVDIIKALGTTDERHLALRPAGTVVGELSLFSAEGRHTASVLAHGPLEMLAMTRAGFDHFLARQPRLAYGLVQTLSLRLIEAEQATIHDLREKNQALAEAYRSLQAAQARLVEQEKIERELEVARRIQCSLLCNLPPRNAGADLGAFIEPMSAVGGDFYDFIEFPDGRLGIAIGDVSDHGVPAALFQTMTVTLLRSAARAAPDPASVLRSVNRGLLEFNMSGMFVTVLYGLLDPRQREFSYARAGHEPPLLHVAMPPSAAAPAAAPAAASRGSEETGVWVVDRSAWSTPSSPAPARPAGRRGRKARLLGESEGAPRARAGAGQPAPDASPAPSSARTVKASAFRRGQVLGVFPAPELDEQRLLLPAHSTLLLYTDGAREAWNPAGEMFGEKGLRAMLAATESEPAQTVCERLFQRLADYRGPLPQQDDITLVSVRC